MVGKSSVSCLQEYCAKNKLESPVYESVDDTDGGFSCEVTVEASEGGGIMSAIGSGRSKRDAKHLAAANLIKKMRIEHPGLDEIPQVQHDEVLPNQDMIIILRDYCVQNQHPLPTIDVVQQSGTPDSPEFTAVCQVASIRRYGVSEKKKDARQKAAYEMLRVIVGEEKLDHQKQLATVDSSSKMEDIEMERYRKFKTYRELTESNTGEIPGVLLCDRHNYFTNFFEELKQKAYKILYDCSSYETDEAKAMDLLDALKITPKITEVPGMTSLQPLLQIELNTDFDVVFINYRNKIFKEINDYFNIMLHK